VVQNVPLAEREKRLVPKHRQFLGLAASASLISIRETDEVEDKRIKHFIWQLVLFVDQDANEQRVRTSVEAIRTGMASSEY
jgi:hypothetical protein